MIVGVGGMVRHVTTQEAWTKGAIRIILIFSVQRWNYRLPSV